MGIEVKRRRPGTDEEFAREREHRRHFQNGYVGLGAAPVFTAIVGDEHAGVFRAGVYSFGIIGIDLDTTHMPKGQRPVGLHPVFAPSVEAIPTGIGRQMQRAFFVSRHKFLGRVMC